jgi:AAA+ ATPase superfamily predicted ATPase
MINQTSEVFGISRELPLNYIERESADARLIDNLSREKHLVIFGSSKQGKTSLRKHALNDDEYIVVHCSNKWQVFDLHSSILKKAGFELTQSTSKTTSGKSKIFAKMAAKILGSGMEVGAESDRTETNEITTKPLELDPEDVNDIITALKAIGFSKFIVLEDFHYLPVETQRDFSVALKAFHEESKYCFIVVGVWLEENRLTVYNGDLTGRITSINADRWEEEELRHVISKGEDLLNISFNKDFVEGLLDDCFGSVYIVQEACLQCCIKEGINQTQRVYTEIGAYVSPHEIVSIVVAQQTGRFNSFITQFADGFQSTTLEMYKWLLYPILTSKSEALWAGLKYSEIRDILSKNHPHGKELNPGNITQALQSTAALQVKKEVKPIVLDYDQTNQRLRVVDSSFLMGTSKNCKTA